MATMMMLMIKKPYLSSLLWTKMMHAKCRTTNTRNNEDFIGNHSHHDWCSLDIWKSVKSFMNCQHTNSRSYIFMRSTERSLMDKVSTFNCFSQGYFSLSNVLTTFPLQAQRVSQSCVVFRRDIQYGRGFNWVVHRNDLKYFSRWFRVNELLETN